jgi:hypothetical protein
MNLKHLGAAAFASVLLTTAGGAFAQSATAPASSDATMAATPDAATAAPAPVVAPVEEHHDFPWGLLGLLGLAGLLGLRRKPDVHVDHSTGSRPVR